VEAGEELGASLGGEVVLPEAEDLPAAGAQGAGDGLVAESVGEEFFWRKRRLSFRRWSGQCWCGRKFDSGHEVLGEFHGKIPASFTPYRPK
jgi:hypothetical protein